MCSLLDYRCWKFHFDCFKASIIRSKKSWGRKFGPPGRSRVKHKSSIYVCMNIYYMHVCVYVCMYVFHQRCLRSNLGIHWTTHTPDTEVLEKANTISIEAHIHRHRLRWVGHAIRLDDDRIPKQLLYGELSVGSRPQHKLKKRFKDCVKNSLALCKIDDPDWEMVACDRNRWRKMVYSGSRCFQDNANIWAKTKRAARKGDNIDQDLSQFVCKECGRVCLSSAGLTSHRRSHAERPLANYEAFLGINQLACEECGKVCKSRSGLARHLKIHQAPGSGEHKGKAQPKDFVCCVCGRVCKSLAGFQSHCRSHDRQ